MGKIRVDSMIKIVCFDFSKTVSMDSGFGSGPIYMGRKKEYDEIYKKFNLHELDEEQFILSVIKLWKGIGKSDLLKIYKKIRLSKNVKSTLRKLKRKEIRTALVSFLPLALAEFYRDLGIDYISATKCDIKNGKISGKVRRMNADKYKSIMEICKNAKLKPKECMVVGDGLQDIRMFKAVGYNNSVAFNEQNEVKKYAKYHIKDFKELIPMVDSIK